MKCDNVKIAIIMTDISEKYPVSFEDLDESWDWLKYTAIMDNSVGNSIIYLERAKDIMQALGEIAKTHAFYGKKAACMLQYFWFNLIPDENLIDCIKSDEERYLKLKIAAIRWANSSFKEEN